MQPLDNPPNPWATSHVDWLGEPPPVELQVYEEQARSIVAENDSPDIPFRWSVNAYRGCYHGCAYCYARPTSSVSGIWRGHRLSNVASSSRRTPPNCCATRLLTRDVMAGRDDRLQRALPTVTSRSRLAIELTRACLEVCSRVSAAGRHHHQRRARSSATSTVLAESRGPRRSHGLRQRAVRSMLADSRVPSNRSWPCRSAGCARWSKLAAAGVTGRGERFAGDPGAQRPRGAVDLRKRPARRAQRQAFHVLLRLPAEVEDVFTARLRSGVPAACGQGAVATASDARWAQQRRLALAPGCAGKEPRYQLDCEQSVCPHVRSAIGAEDCRPQRRGAGDRRFAGRTGEQWLFGDEAVAA